ncbi:GGDEF domain-containing protein [Nitrincola sp. A-D6]|uniref:GGDEF domain-containing protein n=1 Tax=Nitrincola sp. A-D6 TaxID=1545442 RepID=UPI00068C4F71|nr:GGDEF domain-containing protein [Nitrincola sp. A-D6]
MSLPILQLRHSIATRLTAALLSFLLLFLLMAGIAYYRSATFENVLTGIVSTSLPEIRQAAMLAAQVKELPYLTEQLTRAESQAMRRLAYRDIEQKSRDIQQLLSEQQSHQLALKFDAIQRELRYLNELIEQHLYYQQAISHLLQEIYRFYDQVAVVARDSQALPQWALNFSGIIVRVGQVQSVDRLNELRQLTELIRNDLSKQQALLNTLDASLRTNAMTLQDSLSLLLLDETGLIKLRSEQLRIDGRVTGRTRFIRSMVQDFGFEAEHITLKKQSQLIQEVGDMSEKLNRQTYWIGVLSLLALGFLVVIIWCIKIQVINRLQRLKTMVMTKVDDSSPEQIYIGGRDEITELAKAFNFYALQANEQSNRVEALSRTDGLTGISNRRGFDHQLERLVSLCRERKLPLCVLMIDVDFFKNYNDLYGHQAGDECLRQVAELLRRVVSRSQDFVARYGGEEFVCILPETDITAARILASELLSAMSALKIEHKGSSVADHLTLSIGITGCDGENMPAADILIGLADAALYEAKAKGRNSMVEKQCGIDA